MLAALCKRVSHQMCVAFSACFTSLDDLIKSPQSGRSLCVSADASVLHVGPAGVGTTNTPMAEQHY